MNLTRDNLQYWADHYDYGDEEVEKEIKKKLKRQHYLTKEDLITIGLWKSHRPLKHYQKNNDEDVRTITHLSFSAKNERVRIGTLLILSGVSYPLASTILHFAFPERYPILDFRALWSLGKRQPKSYTFEYWDEYCKEIWSLAKRTGVSVRTIDKALWQYSKENQK